MRSNERLRRHNCDAYANAGGNRILAPCRKHGQVCYEDPGTVVIMEPKK